MTWSMCSSYSGKEGRGAANIGTAPKRVLRNDSIWRGRSGAVQTDRDDAIQSGAARVPATEEEEAPPRCDRRSIGDPARQPARTAHRACDGIDRQNRGGLRAKRAPTSAQDVEHSAKRGAG